MIYKKKIKEKQKFYNESTKLTKMENDIEIL